ERVGGVEHEPDPVTQAALERDGGLPERPPGASVGGRRPHPRGGRLVGDLRFLAVTGLEAPAHPPRQPAKLGRDRGACRSVHPSTFDSQSAMNLTECITFASTGLPLTAAHSAARVVAVRRSMIGRNWSSASQGSTGQAIWPRSLIFDVT